MMDDSEVSKNERSRDLKIPDLSSNGSSNSSNLGKYILPIALAVMAALNPACSKKEEGKNKNEISLPQQKDHPFWDNNKEYFRKVNNGEFSKEEYTQRFKKLPNGEIIFEDIGALVFYKVEKGDTIQTIHEKLSKYKQFEHLKTSSRSKIKSFNVPQSSLTPGMLIPIPLAEEDRTLTDEQFVNYCNEAIDEMTNDEEYGPATRKIIKKTSKGELLAVMLTIAKQESGGKPIGQFELHRWEPHQSAFSFSIFHVLMKESGIKARKNLNLTEGQLYHPKNAAKLFLAFLCEKSKNGSSCNPEKFFPLMKNLEEMALFYNGKAWRKINPNYTRNLSKYYQQSKRLLSIKDLTPEKKTKSQRKSLQRKNHSRREM